MDDQGQRMDDERQDPGAESSPPQDPVDSGTASERELTATAESGPEPKPQPMTVRYSRRRLLILGGSLAAGFVAVAAGLRALGGSPSTSSVSDPVTGEFTAFPVRSVEDVPEVPAAEWTVKVDGLVDRPFSVDHAQWSGLQRMDETVDFHCVEGWGVDNVRWSGVAPSVLLDQAGVKPGGKYVVVHAQSGEYFSTLPMELMTHPQTMLADALGGKALPPVHGGPLRLVVPVQLGYKNVKWVSRLEVTDKPRAGYWESYGYPEDAPIPGG